MGKRQNAAAQNNAFEDFSNYAGRRRVPRRSIQCRIGVLIRGTYHLANAYELGENGMMIDAPVELKDKQLVVVSIRVGQALQGIMLSRVVYTLRGEPGRQPTKYGLQFEQIAFDVKRMIRNYVASNRNEASVHAEPIIKVG